MMDFNERVIPGVSANFLFKEALARYKFAEKYLKKGMKVLDIGCGTGYGSAVLGQKSEVIGLDNDRQAIEFAKKHFGKKAKFVIGNAENLKFPDSYFDLVCAFEVVEHLRNPRNFFKEAKRVLKNGGLFLISTPNGVCSSPYHLRGYNYTEFLSILKDYFGRVNIFGQYKSKKAVEAISDFMKSQKAREDLVRKDILGLRKILPPVWKEKIWKYFGGLFGRASQEILQTQDFQINQKAVEKSDYLIAICLK